MPRDGLILLASGNAHKAGELARLLGGARVEPVPGWEPPVEDGVTFLDNARIKARAAHAQAPGRMVVADDSGIAVDALAGAPGVESARFGGDGLDDAGRCVLLLERLAGAADRSARFVCVLVAIAPDGTETIAEGVLEGSVAHAPAGGGGFGYDPVFVPEGLAVTIAELPPEGKDAISHRGRAVARLAAALGL